MLGKQSEKMIYFDNYADRYPRLVFQVEEGYALKNKDDKYVPKAYICGIETFPSTMSVQPTFSHFGVNFTSFAPLEIFKTGEESLVNKIVDLTELGFNELVRKLTDALSHTQRIHVICNFIDQQLRYKTLLHPSIMQIVLENELSEQTDLHHLHKKYKFSERTMERLFKNTMGISPKTFQRLVRFEKTLALLKDPSVKNTTTIGYMLNYNDQSHFIKDFKSFSNITPFQFQRNNFLLSESSAFISKVG